MAEEKDELSPPLTETTEPDSLTLAIAKHIQDLEKENARYSQRLEKLEEIIERFESEIVPFCMFAIGSIYHNRSPESPENSKIIKMQEEYPKINLPTFMLQNNLPVRLIDPKEREEILDMYFENLHCSIPFAGLQEPQTLPTINRCCQCLGWYSLNKLILCLQSPI